MSFVEASVLRLRPLGKVGHAVAPGKNQAAALDHAHGATGPVGAPLCGGDRVDSVGQALGPGNRRGQEQNGEQKAERQSGDDPWVIRRFGSAAETVY